MCICLVSWVTCRFRECSVCCPLCDQLSPFLPQCWHTLYVQERDVVNGGDGERTGSSLLSSCLTFQRYKSRWHAMLCPATPQPTGSSQPPSQCARKVPFFVLNPAKAKFLKQNKKCGRISNPEIIELSLLPNGSSL